MFTKTDLAKYLTPWTGKPEVAQRGAAKCFANFAIVIGGKWEKNPAFCNELYYKECIAKAIIFKQIDKLVVNQPWYEGGGTKPPIVLHTIGKLFHDMKRLDKAFPFVTIWNKQSIPEDMLPALNSLTTFVSEIVLNPPTPGQLVTEWAKQPSCTSAVAESDFEYPEQFLACLDSCDDYKDDMRDAIKDQKLTSSVESQIFVVNQDISFWKKLLTWGEARDILSPKDSEIVAVAMNGKIPSEKQCGYIFDVYEKCRKVGFKVKPKEVSLNE